MKTELQEKLYKIIDEIASVFDAQEQQIEYLQEQIEENKKKEREFLTGLTSLISRRLGG